MPLFKALPLPVASKLTVSGNAASDALQNAFGIERSRDRIGCAQRPGLHRAVMQRVGENEQARHGAVGLAAQLVANPLHALGRAQIDIDHDAGKVDGRSVGNFRASRWCRLRRRSAECWPVRCSDRCDPRPAAAGAWTEVWVAELSWFLTGWRDVAGGDTASSKHSLQLKGYDEREVVVRSAI